ncbi:MAG: hypothetical protein ACRDYW_09715 [Acidimicrobiales bacterium]
MVVVGGSVVVVVGGSVVVVVGGSVVVVVGGRVVVVVGGCVVGGGGGGVVLGGRVVVVGGRVVVVVGAKGDENGPSKGKTGAPGKVVVVSEEDVVESTGTVATVVVDGRGTRRVVVVVRSTCVPRTSVVVPSDPPRPASATIATAQVASTHQNHRPSRTRCTPRR